MNQRHPAWTAIFEMDEDIHDVRRFGELLRTLGASASDLDPGSVWVLGAPLRELGERLEKRWKEAFTAAGGRA